MKTQFLEVTKDQVLPPLNARPISQKVIASMVPQIVLYGGPFQAPGAVRQGDKVRIVWGYHRTLATWEAGSEKLLVRLLPDGTTEKDEMKFSLIENHNRQNEDFESTLSRINKYAQKEGCTLKEAAAFAGVNPQLCSRWQRCSSVLSDQVKELAEQNKVGISVLYLLSRIAEHAKQLSLLQRYVAKEISRDQLEVLTKPPSKPKKGKADSQRVLGHREKGVVTSITFGANDDYDELLKGIDAARKEIQKNRRLGIPFHLLPQLMVQK